MTAKDFFNLVRRMREAQKSSAKFPALYGQHEQDRKRLERQVDAEIERVDKVLEQRMNPTLFP